MSIYQKFKTCPIFFLQGRDPVRHPAEAAARARPLCLRRGALLGRPLRPLRIVGQDAPPLGPLRRQDPPPLRGPHQGSLGVSKTALLGGAATCSEGFVICFLKVHLACLGSMAAVG